MSVKIWAKVSLLFLSVSVLSGCNILTDLFHQDKKQETRVVSEEPSVQAKTATNKNTAKNSKKKQKKNNRTGKQQAKDNGSAVIVEKQSEPVQEEKIVEAADAEEETPATIDEKPTVSSKPPVVRNTCIGNDNNIKAGFSELSEAAGYSFQPRQPNLVMVTGITVGKGICKGASSYSSIVKHNLAASGRFTLIGNDVSQRILKAASGTSYAYLVRVAKSQNVDYIVSGAAIKNGNKINLILKITDIKSGSTVWQKSSSLQ